MLLRRTFEQLNKKNRSFAMSYKALLRLIGIQGMALPLVVVLGGLLEGTPVQNSISAYYHTNMRDVYVGLLCVVSALLITYKGQVRSDTLMTVTSGIAGLGAALLPCSGSFYREKIGMLLLPAYISDGLHTLCAAVFLTSLALISMFVFTRPDGPVEKGKILRNLVYRLCGILMLFSLIGIAAYKIYPPANEISHLKPVLVLEAFGLLIFGISWLIKSDAVKQGRN